MSEFKGTKGKWEYRYDNVADFYSIYTNLDIEDNSICGIWHEHTIEHEANAKLIAAAPELLEALQKLVGNGFQIPSNIDMENAKKAISKALK